MNVRNVKVTKNKSWPTVVAIKFNAYCLLSCREHATLLFAFGSTHCTVTLHQGHGHQNEHEHIYIGHP